MSFDPFIVWWVEEVGHPPTSDQSEAFRLARLAWIGSRQRLRADLNTILADAKRPLLATGRRPERRGAE